MNMNRRGFIKTMGAVGALSVTGVGLAAQDNLAFAENVQFPTPEHGQPIEAEVDPATGKLTVNEDVLVRYSACLGCYCDCGNRVKIERDTGRILSVGGNPFHPSCAYPPLRFEDSLEEAYLSMSYANGKGNSTRGTLCGRGHGTLDAYSQPDRITMPLKRAGKRGEGKWKPISWDQLIREVTEGGKLFAELGEDFDIEGFKTIHDTTTPLDPKHPDLGPLSNQLVLLGGRSDGRSDVGSRFTSSFGTINQYGHGSACGGAQWAAPLTEQRTAMADSDLDFSEYVLWMGSFPGATGNSFQGIAKRAAKRLATGECKMDVLDPVLGNGNVTPTMPNINWVPIKTTTNAAFSCAAVQWIIENKAYNEEFLQCPSLKAAYDSGYNAYANGAYLVIVDETHPNHRKLMRAADAGIDAPAEVDKKGKPIEQYAVIDVATGEPAAHSTTSKARIDFDGTVNGVHVRSAFLMLKDSVNEQSMEQYAEICGVSVSEIERIAREFTSHGTKASARSMGGTALANGIDSAFSYRVLNALVGSPMMAGGAAPCNIGADTLADGARYNLSTVEGKPKVSSSNAAYISRNAKHWTETSEYKQRVAAGEANPTPKLPWFSVPKASDNQALVSMVHQYPYQAKILLIWMKAQLESSPGALRDSLIERLKDPAVIPLIISCDVVIGEDTQYADYVVPDTNPYESFGTLPQEGWAGYGDAIRWQVKKPDTIQLPDGRYASFEAFAVDVSRVCGVPGFGDNAFTDTKGNSYPFNDACDYFMKAFANLAYDAEPVDDISEGDIKLQGLDNVPEAWKNSVSDEEWPKVLHVMSRGGRYRPIEDSVDEKGRNVYAPSFQAYLYSEMRGAAKNPYNDRYPSGTLSYVPQAFATMQPLDDVYSGKEYPFVSTNYKPRFRSISMLANSPLMRDLCAHNYIEINEDDARELGIADGDNVKAINPTGDVMEGPAWVRGGIAPGTFAVAYGYGHRAYGAQDVDIDGVLTPGSKAIGAGIHLETMLDPTLGDTIYPLADSDSATPARSGGMYKIEKA